MKKNQVIKLLQNKMILAALLTILVAGTAAAGVIALRGDKPEQEAEETKPGFVSETEREEQNGREQLVHLEEDLQGLKNSEQLQQEKDHETKEPIIAERPVQSDRVDAERPGNRTEAEIPVENQEAETLVDGEDAVVYDPEGEQAEEDLPALSFSVGDTMTWPVHGNIILDYSMDTTIFFPTLEQYKCNPGILIQAEVGQPVAAAARGVVAAIGTNEELGNFIMMDLSDDYSILYGQLDNITVSVGQLVETGEVLATVAVPTKYYVVEGPNMYLELRCRQKPVDPLDYIR